MIKERLRRRLPAKQWARLRRMRALFHRLMRPASRRTCNGLSPLSNTWGADRGTPIDRYYIEQFLENHQLDIKGRVLEVKDSTYTDRYGSAVNRSDVLDIDSSNPSATIVADLAAAESVPSHQFDCFILTQTLQCIYDIRAAIKHAHRVLRPGGVLLVTVPALSRLAHTPVDYWRLTVASCSLLFSEIFGSEYVSVRSYGNVLTGMAFLTGMASEELTCQELEYYDSDFPVVIAVHAVKQPLDYLNS